MFGKILRLFSTTLLLASLIQCVGLKAYGQEKFLQGYVIAAQGDTLKGFIAFEDWDVSPTHVDFRKGQIEAPSERLGTEAVNEFFIPSFNLRYKVKQIKFFDINLNSTYHRLPNQPKVDSATVFLKQITTGAKATLFAFPLSTGQTRFYLEKDGSLVDLIYYPYRRTIDSKDYLAVYEGYKDQLLTLFADSEVVKTEIPKYNLKSLRQYIDRYNESFGFKIETGGAEREKELFSIDISASGGMTGWKSRGLDMKNKFTYGFGLRVNLPYNFQNRYIRANLFIIPGLFIKELYGMNIQKVTFKEMDLGFGSYFGRGKFRPYVGMDGSFPTETWRHVIISPHVGIGFLRNFNFEIAHFANFYAVLTKEDFLNRPRFAFTYYLNVNSLLTKKKN